MRNRQTGPPGPGPAAAREAAGAGSFFARQRHHEVLQECLDIPGQPPSVAITLDAVGIGAKTVWIRLPQGCLPFTLQLEVELAAHQRGIHMSRLEEAISALHELDFTDARQYALELARRAIPAQEAGRGRVELVGRLPRLSRTGISGHNSIDAYDLRVEVELAATGRRWDWQVALGVGVNHITACPCTQVYNRLLLPSASSAPASPAGGHGLQPTHSQRSHTTLTVVVRGEGELAALVAPAVPVALEQEQLLQCLATVLHLSQDLLKRPDEAELVYASHNHPQFAEDTVRETAWAAAELLGPRLPPATRIKVTTVSFESIHSHDVHCRLDTTLADLVR